MAKLTDHIVHAIASPQIKAKRYKTRLDTIERVLIDSFVNYNKQEPFSSFPLVVERIVEDIRVKLNDPSFAKGASFEDYENGDKQI